MVSAQGEFSVPVKYSDDMAPGVLFMPRNFAEAPVGALMTSAAGEAETAVVRVRVVKG
jgi:hypothetical protein